MSMVIINGRAIQVDTKAGIERAQEEMSHIGLQETEVYVEDTAVNTLTTDPLDPKAYALAAELGCSPLDCEPCQYGGNQWESTENPGEYLVLDESERETAADQALDNYIDECILSDVPENIRHYFDSKAWKRDALMSDGYGHTLASYDHNEREQKIHGVWYFIYRVG